MLRTMFDRVVVPLDLGGPADRALPVAQAVARKLGARLDAVMVTSRGVDPRVDEHEARWHARSVGCELDVVELRTDDHVVDGMLAVAGAPRTLLCMASHAHGAAADLVLHSVSEQVLRRAPAPVLAVGPRTVIVPPPRLDAIVCCIGADVALARPLLAVVVEWSHHLGCEPALLQVTAPGAADPASDASADRATLENVTHLARELWAQGVKATWQTVSDPDPASGIVRFVSDLPGAVVVMASHGQTGLRRLVLGSVTLDVLAHSPQPVLVVPARTPANSQVR
jgi:nucleotide-binding universal stress UspA family protein